MITARVRHVALTAVTFATLGMLAGWAAAQTFPSRPIRLIVPWPPGGISDTGARILAQHMSASLGQPVVVDNRGGAASVIGTELVVKSNADGHTLLYTDLTATVINAAGLPKLPYDTLRDLSPVTMVGASPMVMTANGNLPAKTVAELVSLARAKPGTVTFASAGTGSTLHLAGEMFQGAAGAKLLHVPFKGAGPATTSLVSGEVSLLFTASPPVLPHIKTGALRALAVTTASRSKALPDVPALAESYPGFEIFILSGVLGPARLPADRVGTLGKELARALRLPEVQQRLELLGMETRTSSPEELTQFLQREIGRFGKLIRDSGIRME